MINLCIILSSLLQLSSLRAAVATSEADSEQIAVRFRRRNKKGYLKQMVVTIADITEGVDD